MEDHWESKLDPNSRDRAEQIVKDAFLVIIGGTSISPEGEDCPRLRAEIGVRFIANILCELSEEHQLNPDLEATLWSVANGSEPPLPEDLRRCWRTIPDKAE